MIRVIAEITAYLRPGRAKQDMKPSGGAKLGGCYTARISTQDNTKYIQLIKI